MVKEFRPIIFDRHGVAVCNDDGVEQARYNPKGKESPQIALEAATQALARGDIPEPRFRGFEAALTILYGLEQTHEQRVDSDTVIEGLCLNVERTETLSYVLGKKMTNYDRAILKLGAQTKILRSSDGLYSSMLDRLAA